MGRKATDLNYKIAGLPGMKKISCKTGFLRPVFFLACDWQEGNRYKEKAL
jgi:hypothetical protein